MEGEESRARRFNSTVLSGKLRAAVCTATDRDRGDVLFPSDQCTKSRLPILEVLRGKHPDTRTPDLSDLECKSFKDYSNTPEAVPLDV
eukprot:13737159-Ditylum_brightwellii.AAC.1